MNGKQEVSAEAGGDQPATPAPGIGLAGVPYDAPGYAPTAPRMRFEYEENKPERKAAEARAAAMADKIKVQQAVESFQ